MTAPGRFPAFLAVGMMGLVVQVGVIELLFTRMGLPLGWSTLVGVEVALLHNGWWHRRWTWRDRRTRWWRLHTANGLMSLVGTPAMTVAAESLGLPVLVGHVGAVAVVGCLNFLTADRWVFVGGHDAGPGVAPL